MSSNFLCTFILVSFGLGLVPLALGKTCTKQQRVTYMSWKMDPYTQRLRPQPQAFERINIVCCPGYREAFRSGTIPVCVPNCQLNCVGGFCDGKNQCACHEGYRRIGIGHCEPEEGTTTTTTTTAMPTTMTTTTTMPTTTTIMPTTMTTTTTTRRPTTTTRRPTTTTEPTTTTTTMPTTTTTKPTTTTTTMPTTTTTKPTTTTTTMPTTTTTKPTTTTTTMPTTTTTTTVRAVPATSTTTTRTVPTAPTTTTPHPTTTTSTTTPATSTTTTTSPTSSIPKEKFASRFLYKTQQLQIKEATPHATEPQSPLVKFPPLDPRFGTLPATNHLTGLECEGSVNCACPAGYTHDIQASKCRPLCNGKIYGCIGGTCIGANQCRCDEDKYLDSGELFHCRALHFHWKWTLLLLLVPAGLIVISSYVAIRRWRTAKANRLNAQSERFSEVRLHSTNSHSIDEKHQWARRGCDSDDDDDQVSLGASSSRPLFREKVQIL